jgi:hypothetical protein
MQPVERPGLGQIPNSDGRVGACGWYKFPAFSNDFKSLAVSGSSDEVADVSRALHMIPCMSPDSLQYTENEVADVPTALHMVPCISPDSLQYTANVKAHPNKSSSGNWLAAASTMRKHAALNLAKSGTISKTGKPLTAKEMRDRAAAFAFPVDRSGVQYCKEHASWHSLDAKGENPKPVSGMPFWDPFFGELRVYDTAQQRERAIASYQSLVEMGQM